jgi:N-acyl amino acid synthase of PEP-CTERM/exosortase system
MGVTFDEAYETVLADTWAAKRIHYQVRYQVFCQEKGFERADAFPDRQEKDPWDMHSVHFIVRERSSGRWVAAMRMIQSGPSGFPLETLTTLKDGLSPGLLERGSCEISRLCLVKREKGSARNDRCYIRETDFGEVGPSVSDVRESEIMLGLFRAALAYSERNDVNFWYILINRAFARLLARLGVHLKEAGPECDHRGRRTPYLVDLAAGRDFVSKCQCRVAALLNIGPQPYRLFSDVMADWDQGAPILTSAAASGLAACPAR